MSVIETSAAVDVNAVDIKDVEVNAVELNDIELNDIELNPVEVSAGEVEFTAIGVSVAEFAVVGLTELDKASPGDSIGLDIPVVASSLEERGLDKFGMKLVVKLSIEEFVGFVLLFGPGVELAPGDVLAPTSVTSAQVVPSNRQSYTSETNKV